MNEAIRRQIIVSGVGGQGVLFVTRLLAEAAIRKGLPVFTSETHGMAQRGGTVVSHLKVGGFESPLIRLGNADGLLALKAENIPLYRPYNGPGGWVIANGSDVNGLETAVDADALAGEIGVPRGINLIVLGFALACLPASAGSAGGLFCTLDDLKEILADEFQGRDEMRDASIRALEAGHAAFHPKG
jgi:indolepyruvate ferredoxin oxidoreductase beta subunit